VTNPATTTLGLVAYYAGLLARPYITKPNAVATIEATVTPFLMPQTSIQTITFDPIPTGGSFVITYGDNTTGVTINWNDSAATIQAKLRMLPPGVLSGGNASTVFSQIISGGNASTVDFQDLLNGGSAYGWDLSGIEVIGTPTDGLVTVIFDGVVPPAALLDILSSSLVPTSMPVVAEIDLTLPLAVQSGYQLTGENTAVGVQLDVLGKYANVSRNVAGFSTAFSLDDADFLQLILMAIIRNNADSDLSTIDNLIEQFFGDSILVFDYANMHMSFLISQSVGSYQLMQAFVTEGLLPVPMAVSYSVVYVPIPQNLFGFRTYKQAAVNSTPFNSYKSYNPDWKWLSYANAVIP
jgi:hypothetical protein